MMWLMDHVFKYTNFGLVSLIHGDFFIRQVSQKSESESDYLQRNIRIINGVSQALMYTVSHTGQST